MRPDRLLLLNYVTFTDCFHDHVTFYAHVQEIKHLKDQLKEAQQATTVEVQFQMAARTHDLIMGRRDLSPSARIKQSSEQRLYRVYCQTL